MSSNGPSNGQQEKKSWAIFKTVPGARTRETRRTFLGNVQATTHADALVQAAGLWSHYPARSLEAESAQTDDGTMPHANVPQRPPRIPSGPAMDMPPQRRP